MPPTGLSIAKPVASPILNPCHRLFLAGFSREKPVSLTGLDYGGRKERKIRFILKFIVRLEKDMSATRCPSRQ